MVRWLLYPLGHSDPRRALGRKGAYGVAPRWLLDPCPRHHDEQCGQGEGEEQVLARDCPATGPVQDGSTRVPSVSLRFALAAGRYTLGRLGREQIPPR